MFDLKPIATVFRRLGAGIDATAGALRSRFGRRSEPVEALREPGLAEAPPVDVAAATMAPESVQPAPVAAAPARKARKATATKRVKAVAKPAKKSAAKKNPVAAAKAEAKGDAPKAPARRKAAKPKAAPAA